MEIDTSSFGTVDALARWDDAHLLDAMEARHSVRSYRDKRIDADALRELQSVIDGCNEAAGLSFTLVADDPSAFDGALAHYGSFRGVRNHVALIGRKGPRLDETVGYYGEQVVLVAQLLGLNTCWVAMTYRKRGAARTMPGEARPAILALGYGETSGASHKVKPVTSLCRVPGGPAAMPEWFAAGMRAAQLAPTAMNQQAFSFELVEGEVPGVRARLGLGPCAKIDLGIARCHFEIGARSVVALAVGSGAISRGVCRTRLTIGEAARKPRDSSGSRCRAARGSARCGSAR